MGRELQPHRSPETSRQRPASAKASTTAEVLSRLLSPFPERDGDDEGKLDRFRAYMIAVEDFPGEVLVEAERRILKGEAGEIDPRFAPTPPQLARLCRALVAERRASAPRPDPVASLEKFAAPPDPNVVVKLERFQDALARQADRDRHETRWEWLERMGDRVKRVDDAT